MLNAAEKEERALEWQERPDWKEVLLTNTGMWQYVCGNIHVKSINICLKALYMTMNNTETGQNILFS